MSCQLIPRGLVEINTGGGGGNCKNKINLVFKIFFNIAMEKDFM